MKFYVMESLRFDVIVRDPAPEAIRRCVDFGLQQVILVSDGKKTTFPFEYAVAEFPVEDSLETNSEDFFSDSDVTPNVDKDSREDLVAALAKDLQLSDDDYSAPSLSGSVPEVSAVRKKLSHLDEHAQHTLFPLLKTSSTVAWSLRSSFSAHVSVKYYFELTDSRSIPH